jgi:hypothetical protein
VREKAVLDVYVGNLPKRISVDDLHELFDGVMGQKTFASRKGSQQGLPRGLRPDVWLAPLAAILARVSWAQNLLSNIRKIPRAAELNFTMVSDAQGHFARYCRVSGYSRSRATRLIEQLAGVGLQGRVLEVRPFYTRNLSNDRRRAGWQFHRWLGVERRVGERRREK